MVEPEARHCRTTRRRRREARQQTFATVTFEEDESGGGSKGAELPAVGCAGRDSEDQPE